MLPNFLAVCVGTEVRPTVGMSIPILDLDLVKNAVLIRRVRNDPAIEPLPTKCTGFRRLDLALNCENSRPAAKTLLDAPTQETLSQFFSHQAVQCGSVPLAALYVSVKE